MFLWTWSSGMRLASSLFRCPLIHKEERFWNVKCRLGPVISAFLPLSAKENRVFSTLSCAPHLAVGEETQREQEGSQRSANGKFD